ncbi:MAG: NAD-dependent epimerase/dehydratase family protein [Acidimicrobiales bacterium]
MTALVSSAEPAIAPAGSVVLLGAGGALGQRLVQRLSALHVEVRAIGDDVVDRGVDGAQLDGAGSLIVLGPWHGPDLDGRGGSGIDLRTVRATLRAAAEAGVRHLVVVSSAMVYGAWPDNPVPLTEDAPLRPDPHLPAVSSMAELERLAAVWRDDHPGASVAILRPVVMVASETAPWFRRSPWRSSGLQVDDADPPRQFVHLDDVAAAVELAWRERLDGSFNVAPDGWLPTEVWHDLGGPAPRLRLPVRLVARLRRVWFRAGLSDVPPELLPYTRYPWVVANDRLRGAGWTPTYTNEEAYVSADHAGPLRSMSPRTRQELSLAAAGLVLAAVVAGVAVLLRRSYRRTR